MARRILAGVAAIAVAVYFLAWGYGLLDLDRGDVFESRVAHWGSFVVAPCVLVGIAVGRWAAIAVCLVFPAVELLPARCVTSHSSDVVIATCYSDGGWSEVPLWFAITVPCVVAGVALTQFFGTRCGRPRSRVVGEHARRATATTRLFDCRFR